MTFQALDQKGQQFLDLIDNDNNSVKIVDGGLYFIFSFYFILFFFYFSFLIFYF